MICNKRGLADIFDVSERTLTEYIGEGMPIQQRASRRGQSHQFDTTAVYRWLLDREIGKRIDDAGDDGPLDLQQERARLARVQREKLQREIDALDGKLIPADEIEAVWSRLVNNFRTRSLAIPSRLAPVVAGELDTGRCFDLLEAAIHEALTELSEHGADKPGVETQ